MPNDYFNNFIVLRHYSDVVKLINFDNQRIILKKITLPISFEQEKLKKEYVDFLYEYEVSVARILNCLQFNDQEIYEFQEFIEDDIKENNHIILSKALARYHKISKNWTKPDFNDSKYDTLITCCDVQLSRVLLGFEEKYYIYPINNYRQNKELLSPIYAEKLAKLVIIYKIAYQQFIEHYRKDTTICHNDLTSNNIIIKNSVPCFIDFDFAINTSPYVDIADILLHRSINLNWIATQFDSFKTDVLHFADEYSKINDIIEIPAIYCMLIIKLISFYLYINLNATNLHKLIRNLDVLDTIIRLFLKET